MGIVVVGSIALDILSLPGLKRRQVTGGSAVYSALSLCPFAPVRLVGVIGDDFPGQVIDLLTQRGVDLEGVEKKSGKTFCWEAEYDRNLSEAKTLATNLNVFAGFSPRLPERYKNEKAVFLGNIDPGLQADVLSQMKSPKIVAADTIECWLDLKSDALRKILPRVNIFFMNESEAKRFSGEPKVLRAARTISRLGPRLVIIKSGEHGAMAYDGESDNCFWAPAFPTFEVVDPTGAGDSFAGGFLGTAVSSGDPFHPSMIKKALFMGNVMSSFAISAVSIDGLVSLKSEEIAKRLEILKAAVSNGEGDGGVTSQISSLLKSLSR